MTCLLATPGRLVDHLENTKGFNLRSLKYLVCLVTMCCCLKNFPIVLNVLVECQRWVKYSIVQVQVLT